MRVYIAVLSLSIMATAQAPIQAHIGRWVTSWNTYDLEAVDRLFWADPSLSYFSSEKPGLILGPGAVKSHHEGFGFVPGGKVQGNRLWLGPLHVQPAGPTATVAANWYFQKTNGSLQQGPVTFVLRGGPRDWRIAHVHFANDPAIPKAVPALAVEAVSLLGKPLTAPTLPEAARSRHAQHLEVMRARLATHPRDADAWIWVGRRLAYLGKYREAIAHFTEGIARFPEDARFYRHRGHRLLTVRCIDLALNDFQKAQALLGPNADALEPDGLPNAQNLPLSTLRSNVLYHLALSHYLLGQFPEAARVFQACHDALDNEDNRVAASYWRFLALRRAGLKAEADRVLASIHPGQRLVENGAYHRLLLAFKGQTSKATPNEGELLPGLDDATAAYGRAVWKLLQGDEEGARKGFHALVEGPGWGAFAVLAAEADLLRGMVEVGQFFG